MNKMLRSTIVYGVQPVLSSSTLCEARREDCVPTGIVITNTDCTVDEVRPGCARCHGPARRWRRAWCMRRSMEPSSGCIAATTAQTGGSRSGHRTPARRGDRQDRGLDTPPDRPRQQVGCRPDRGYGFRRDDRRSAFRRQPDPGAPSGREGHPTAPRPRRRPTGRPPYLPMERSHRGRLSGIREFRHVEIRYDKPDRSSRTLPYACSTVINAR